MQLTTSWPRLRNSISSKVTGKEERHRGYWYFNSFEFLLQMNNKIREHSSCLSLHFFCHFFCLSRLCAPNHKTRHKKLSTPLSSLRRPPRRLSCSIATSSLTLSPSHTHSLATPPAPRPPSHSTTSRESQTTNPSQQQDSGTP